MGASGSLGSILTRIIGEAGHKPVLLYLNVKVLRRGRKPSPVNLVHGATKDLLDRLGEEHGWPILIAVARSIARPSRGRPRQKIKKLDNFVYLVDMIVAAHRRAGAKKPLQSALAEIRGLERSDGRSVDIKTLMDYYNRSKRNNAELDARFAQAVEHIARSAPASLQPREKMRWAAASICWDWGTDAGAAMIRLDRTNRRTRRAATRTSNP